MRKYEPFSLFKTKERSIIVTDQEYYVECSLLIYALVIYGNYYFFLPLRYVRSFTLLIHCGYVSCHLSRSSVCDNNTWTHKTVTLQLHTTSRSQFGVTITHCHTVMWWKAARRHCLWDSAEIVRSWWVAGAGAAVARSWRLGPHTQITTVTSGRWSRKNAVVTFLPSLSCLFSGAHRALLMPFPSNLVLCTEYKAKSGTWKRGTL